MTEYWVAKKQYWCKYCSVFIRDDAPSRRSHETGLKHSGNKERFIRDLYRNGNKAKIEKAEEAVQIARIEAAALGTGATASRLSVLDALRAQPGHKAKPSSRSTDKFANYSSAKDLGFVEEAEKTSFEVEQEIKGRAADIGAWQTVEHEPTGYYTEPQPEASSSKRKLGEYTVGDDETHEGFRIQKKRDPYEDDDWDPAAIQVKKKEEVIGAEPGGKPLEWERWQRPTEIKQGGWTSLVENTVDEGSPEVKEEPEVKEPEVKEEPEPEVQSLFKKRRPPPSSRKK